MAARRFDIFGAGQQSKSRKVSAQRRVNVYYQFEEQEQDTTKVSIFGTPGFDLFVDQGDTPWRTLIAPEKSSVMYGVHRSTFYEINNAGVVTSRGTLEGVSGRCYAAENGSQVMIVDPTDSGKGYIYTISGASFAKITNVNFPGALNVDFLDGFFLVPKPDSGRWYKSASYDGSTWSATDFTNAEASPDNTKLVKVAKKQVNVFGENTTEFYTNAGTSGFPFQSIQGAALNWGIAASASAVAVGDGMIALMKNKDGQPRLGMITGYVMERLSDDAWEQIVQRYGTYSDATGFSYMMDGHVFYQINFPTAGKSWLFDLNTRMYFERESSGGRQRCDMAVAFNNQIVVADYSNGKLYRLKPDTYTENGTAIRRELVSRHLFDGNDLLTCSSVEFLFETGVGLTSGQGSDPKVMLDVSKDGGATYAIQNRLGDLGALGNYTTRCRFDRLGQARDFVLRLSMTDPVKFALIGESIDMRNDTKQQKSRARPM